MIYNIYSPSFKLENVIKNYIIIDSLDMLDALLFLPNGCNFIIFNRGLEGYSTIYNEDEKFHIPKKYSFSIKSNKVRKLVLNRADKQSDLNFPILMVELTPIGFYKLFSIDASVLNKRYLEMEDEVVENYFKHLYNHSCIEDELLYLNKSFESLLDSKDNVHIPIEDILDKIINSYHYEVSAEALAEEFNCSISTLERNFKKIIGLTPKQYIFVAKFCKTVLAYVKDECTFNELEYLYSDNSHMNSVFKKFLGVSPSVILNDVKNNKIRIYQLHKDLKK